MPFKYGKVQSDSSIEDEQHPGPGRITFWSRMCDITRKFQWPSLYLLLLVVLAAQIQILHRQPASMPIGSETNGLVPNFGTSQKKFIKDDRYNSDHNTSSSIASAKEEWHKLAPKGGGFIQVLDYTSHALPPPMHFDKYPALRGKNTYVLAVFHQMHCLYHMQAYMDTLAMQIRAGNMTLDEHKLIHNDHCFNYLRNAIMCAADTTLEGQIVRPDHDPSVAGTDGTGAMHVCKNWDEVVRWAEGNRLYDKAHL
ncbi:hypothetical protein G6514_001381 [Epicoccum nigrum]|nr:hypothetical protein G6514_001381 [Epicoccum nigrum]